MITKDFSFANMAPVFQDHITRSIPGYKDLVEKSVGISRRFVRSGTNVIDLGCSSGNLIAGFREHNAGRSDVSYVGIDIVDDFRPSWEKYSLSNLHFVVEDIRTYAGYRNSSLVSSFFTLQFMKEDDRFPLLTRIHDGLIDGGAVIIAEKVLAGTGRLQEALTFPYYDFKQQNGFTSDETLAKEKQLRGQMVPWTQVELLEALSEAGFSEHQIIWCSFPFVAVLALKNSYSSILKASSSAVPLIGSREILKESSDRWKLGRRILRETIGQTPLAPLRHLIQL